MFKKNIIIFFIFFIVLFLGYYCTHQKNTNQKLSIITTFLPLYSFTTNIVADKADVYNLVPPGTSIHTYQLKPSDIEKIAKADVLIINGLGLEEFLKDAIEAADNKKLVIIDSSQGILSMNQTKTVEFEKEKTQEHIGINPHIWLSLQNAIQQVQNITENLQNIDPNNNIFYIENSRNYIQKLLQLDQDIKEELGKIEKKPFIVFHPAYDYFVRDYGLNQIAAIEEFPGKEPSALYLKNIIDLLSENQVSLIFTEPQFSPKLVEQLSQDYNIITAELDPIGINLSPDEYERIMRENLEVIIENFKKV